MAMFPAFLDTCTLYDAYLCDSLLRLADAGTYRPLWSADVLDELERALVVRGLEKKAVTHRIGEMRRAFPDAEVRGYENLVETMTCDPKDPEADPDTWCFGCNICGLELTGAMLRVSPVVHVIRTMERTRAGLPREIELRYGGARSLGQILGRLSTAHAALDVRAGWRDGQRCKLAQLADAGGNHGASLHRDRPGYDGGPLPSGFRRGGDW
jgi:hypothetical protein